jgi:hypothetical protein
VNIDASRKRVISVATSSGKQVVRGIDRLIHSISWRDRPKRDRRTLLGAFGDYTEDEMGLEGSVPAFVEQRRKPVRGFSDSLGRRILGSPYPETRIAPPL